MRATAWFLATTTAAVLTLASSQAAAPKFYPDDPLSREPETQDASRAEGTSINLFADVLVNLFMKPGDRTPGVRAGNINTIDEVPDSGWFTNRLGARPMTAADISRGANVGPGPAPGRWTVIGAKLSGAAPGFRVRDSLGEVWFLSLDVKGAPRRATGAIAVASRLYWALGYHQVEQYVASFRPGDLDIPETTTFETRAGYSRPMNPEDIDQVLGQSARDPDGSYRVMAARLIPGRIVGGFRYYGTRPDDPNDIVPHEHRRELRALQVFGAWTNFVDMKALNTIDTVVEENGRHVIRHYLQDVGSMFGTGAYEPHDWDQGHEYLYEGSATWRRLVTAGFYLQPWQTQPFY
jgi:hypothetical protein